MVRTRHHPSVRGGAADAELYLYPGSAHLFTDATLADYDESAASLVLERSKEFLSRWP